MNWTSPEFATLARLVRVRTGLIFRAGRRAAFELGVRRAMTRLGLAHLPQYHGRIADDVEAMDDLVAELTVPETYFFREPGQFEFLRGVVLPEVVGRLADGQPLRAWSAGCSSGEEAYSLAILFAEEGLAGRSHVLATDISRAVLAKARRGAYSTWSLRGDLSCLARRYLRPDGDRDVIDGSIRRAVTFEHLNLAVDSYPSYATGVWGMDLILCRNVLIYFEADTVKRVARRLLRSLSEGGWLVTASTDPPLGKLAEFESVVTPQGVFYRRPRVTSHPTRTALSPAPDLPTTAADADAVWNASDRAKATEVAPEPALKEEEGLSRVLSDARADLAAGRYSEAAARTESVVGDAEASVLCVRALANVDAAGAERACAGSVARHPLSAELQYLHAVLLLGLGREEGAARAARRALYLDRSLAVAHFLLGSILRKRGDRDGARRAFRNARDLCAARPPGEAVALVEGETTGRLAESARWLMAEVERAGGCTP